MRGRRSPTGANSRDSLAGAGKQASAATPKPERFGALIRTPWRSRTIMLYLFQVLLAFGYYGFGSLVPIILAAKGFRPRPFAHDQCADVPRLPHRLRALHSDHGVSAAEVADIRRALGMAGFGLAFGYSTTGVAVSILGVCYTAISNAFSNAFHTYQAELFPTSLRATAAGSAHSLSRLATAAMPFVLLPALEEQGATGVFVVVTIAMAILIADVAVLGPRTTGRTVEEISMCVNDVADAVSTMDRSRLGIKASRQARPRRKAVSAWLPYRCTGRGRTRVAGRWRDHRGPSPGRWRRNGRLPRGRPPGHSPPT